MEVWSGAFGRDYTDRNTLTPAQLEDSYRQRYGITRTEMNGDFIGHLERSARILEVGANIGNQLLLLQEMGFRRLYGLERRDALALASVAVDLRVTQIVNQVVGAHAVLPLDFVARNGST